MRKLGLSFGARTRGSALAFAMLASACKTSPETAPPGASAPVVAAIPDAAPSAGATNLAAPSGVSPAPSNASGTPYSDQTKNIQARSGETFPWRSPTTSPCR